MPRRRLPAEIWNEIRKKVWERDQHKCVHCNCQVDLFNCHIDHLISGKLGSNHISNLRTLCKRCHALRYDFRHRGMISNALKHGYIQPNWREELWEG